VTDDVESAVHQARQGAGDKDVQVAGGTNTIQQVIRADSIDELYLHVKPMVLGRGERLLETIDHPKLTQVE